MLDSKKSIAKKIIKYVFLIFVISNILLYVGVILINKKAFKELEKDKNQIILKTYAPLVSTSLYLNLTNNLNTLVKQILKNKSITKVEIYQNNRLIITKQKISFKKDKNIILKSKIYEPNTKNKIGKLVLFYFPDKYEHFIKKYNIWVILNLVGVFIIFFIMTIYIKKLLNPLRKLAKFIKEHPQGTLTGKVPYTEKEDEIGLLASSIHEAQNKIMEYSKNLQDVTEHIIKNNVELQKKVDEEVKKAREKDTQLLQQSRLAQMGEMISMIAHQWRQPLSAISTTTGSLNFKLMLDDIDKDELIEEIINIEKYVQHLSKTIDDFRNFFKQNKQKEWISIKKVIEDSVSIIKNVLTSKNITILTEYDCDMDIKTYPNELRQVLLNLIANSKDAILENDTKNPTIIIKSECKDDKVYILCIDNAGGIPENIINNIFNPYFSTKLEKDGTGLGLYMSKIIIKEHCNGEITASNNKTGAVFKIELNKNGGGK